MADLKAPVLFGNLVRYNEGIKKSYIAKPTNQATNNQALMAKEDVSGKIQIVWSDIEQADDLFILCTTLPVIDSNTDDRKIYIVKEDILDTDSITVLDTKYKSYVFDKISSKYLPISNSNTITDEDIQKYLYELDSDGKVDLTKPKFIEMPQLLTKGQIFIADENGKLILSDELYNKINDLEQEIGTKADITPAYYELDPHGLLEVVADDLFTNELTQVKESDVIGIATIGEHVTYHPEVINSPATGMYQFIANSIAKAQLDGQDIDLSGYQEKSSNDLITSDKTIVGAINELVNILVVPPEYIKPTLKITTNPATLKQEVGTTITPVLSYTFTQNDAGAELSHSYSPLDNATQAQLTIVEGDNIEYSVTVNYEKGIQKNDNFGKPNGTPIQAGSLTAKVKYVGIRNMFYGVNTVVNTYTDSTAVRALTAKEIGATKITVPVGSKQIVIAVPSTKTINAISYVEQGNANYLGNFTKITVQVSGATAGADLINYDVYTYNLAIANASIMTFNVTIV